MPHRSRVRRTVVPIQVAGPSLPPPPPPPPVFHAMTSPNFRLEDLAYAKLVLHALKYPHRTVNGVLLGHPPSSGTVVIVDAVPLQHHWTNLSPMMEVGLGMVRSASSLSSSLIESRMFYTLRGCRPLIMPKVVGFM
jgi:hypothetical protein